MKLLNRLFGPSKKSASGGAEKTTKDPIEKPSAKNTEVTVEEVNVITEEVKEEPHGLNEFSIKEIMVQKKLYP